MPEKKPERLNQRPVWRIPVESGELLVSDPCYIMPSDKSGKRTFRFDGRYGARVNLAGGASFATCSLVRRRVWPGAGGTVRGMAVQLVRPGPRHPRQHLKAAIGVDSGQVMVADPVILERERAGLTYLDLCTTVDAPASLVTRRPSVTGGPSVAVGFVTGTVDGDGEYDLWLTCNEYGEVLELFVDFETFWHDGTDD